MKTQDQNPADGKVRSADDLTDRGFVAVIKVHFSGREVRDLPSSLVYVPRVAFQSTGKSIHTRMLLWRPTYPWMP